MPGNDIAAQGNALTANGGNNGTITISSTAGYRVGALCWLTSSTQPSLYVKILRVISATQLSITAVPESGARYNTTDVSAYLLADGARIDMEKQFIYNEPRTP